MNSPTLICTIVTPDKVLFDGKITRAMLPGSQGTLAILPGHWPLYSQLVSGEIEIIDNNNRTKTYPIETGVVRVRTDNITIMLGF